MIRMGRTQKPEPASEPEYQPVRTQETESLYPPANQNAVANRAVTDSESMARDIKEGRLSGFIGSGTVLTGETTFQAMLRIDGHLTGSISSENGTLIIGSTGRVDADVAVASATIYGMVNGDIIVSERLELKRTAHITGNIQAPRLVIDDGAILEGNCLMVRAKENLEKRTAEASQPRMMNESAVPPEAVEANDANQFLDITGEERDEALTN